jgi:hypothetical protein
MKGKILGYLLVITFIIKYSDGYSQNSVNIGEKGIKVLDSLSGKELIYRTTTGVTDIKLNKDQSVEYLRSMYNIDNWKNPDDPLRKAIGQLLFFTSNNPFDSTRFFLDKYSYDSINIPWNKFYVWDTLKIKIPVLSLPRFTLPSDTLIKVDTLFKKNISDSLKIDVNDNFTDLLSQSQRPSVSLKDSIVLVAKDTLHELTSSSSGFPFKYYNYPYQADSIFAAIKELIVFYEARDSSKLNFSGITGRTVPVWLNSKNDNMVRYWLKDKYSDSVTIWIGCISRNTIGLYLEDGVIFRRPAKQFNISDSQLTLKQINSGRLLDVNTAYVKPHYWKFRSESSLVLSQVSLSNWVTGGESSISTAMDITRYADYNNKRLKLLSNNFIRLKYGYVASGKEGVRKNIDLLETNSKINHKAFGKFDFSAIMLFKTQIAKGFTYTDSSKTMVSKFMNPAILTIGLGIDFKPNKTTSVNFAPLSYKATFVTDTAHIDQTKYGVPHNKKSLQEPGISLQISNEFKPYKTITLINRLQLFTNYIHNPQNIDIDWEMIATANLNWFTDVRFNTHLIFDDDTKTPLFDKKGKPVLNELGKQKKTARIQFKELLGFSLNFRF